MGNPLCQEHGMEAVVKANIRNKTTGRLYPPFYSCPWTGEDAETGKKVYCKTRFEEKPSATSLASGIQQSQQAASSNKDSQIKFMNALNVAGQLLANGKIEIGDEPWQTVLKEAADSVYRMLPPN